MKWNKRLWHLAAATVVVLAVSLSYAIIVDAIPKDKRPYIGSSQTNSVLELALVLYGLAVICFLLAFRHHGKAARWIRGMVYGKIFRGDSGT
jgi:4-amino-4-deoxy-L-arabinose transferase-like glycosyltransferase